LQGFAYRVSIGVDVFLVAGASVVGIALVTVAYQAVKAATLNPVRSLRSE
jgi:putative ABC transport system permease protein